MGPERLLGTFVFVFLYLYLYYDNTRWKCCHNTNINTKIQIQKSPEVSQGVTYCSPTSTLPPCNSTMITPDGNVVIIQIQIQKYKYKYKNTNTKVTRSLSGSDLLLSYFYPPSLQQHDDNTRWKCCHNTNTNTKIQIQIQKYKYKSHQKSLKECL